MSIDQKQPKDLETQGDEKAKLREAFWQKRCEEEPGYAGCKIYDL